ncbi:MAG: threonine synthase [Bacteroidetes bacterium]|nr:threonine synthase [Bacteroidota bacterium]
MNQKYYFKCTDCGKIYQNNEVSYLCSACETANDDKHPPRGVLKTLYHYDEIREKYGRNVLFKSLSDSAFIDLLPVQSIDSMGYLRVGQTPLYAINKLDGDSLDFTLYLKDDAQNPTASFKDRASVLVSAFAKENNIDTIAAASTGNAGSSLAGICASQQQKAIIFVPATAPLAKLTQILMYGAVIIPVDGNYDAAFDLSIKASKHFGWYNRNTAYNPLTIEGKKTVSFELFAQLQQGIPDRIFVPVGDGVIISGVYKGFEDLLQLGIIDKMPVIVAIQAEGSKNVIENLSTDNWKTIPSTTIADSISVDIPRNFYMTKDYLLKYKGEWLTVTDDEIIDSSAILSKNTGIFSEPASCAAFAGMLKYKKLNKFEKLSKNVVLLTGSGLKDLKAVSSLIKIPAAIPATIEAVIKLLYT